MSDAIAGRVDVGDLVKTLLWDVIVKLALAKLATTLPFLALPVVGPLVGVIVALVGDQIYEALRETVQLEVIVIKNEAARRAYTEAQVDLKKIAALKGKDSAEFQEARLVHQQKLSRFIAFNVPS